MHLHTFVKEVAEIIFDSFFLFLKILKATVLIKNDKMIHQVYSASKAENLGPSQESNTFNDSRDKVVTWKPTSTACTDSGLFVFYLLM